jgi:hypothetical protein
MAVKNEVTAGYWKTLSGKYQEALSVVNNGGDRGIRTPDLCDANAALSQLSYIPTDANYNTPPNTAKPLTNSRKKACVTSRTA